MEITWANKIAKTRTFKRWFKRSDEHRAKVKPAQITFDFTKQVFPTREKAVAYAKRKGIRYYATVDVRYYPDTTKIRGVPHVSGKPASKGVALYRAPASAIKVVEKRFGMRLDFFTESLW